MQVDPILLTLRGIIAEDRTLQEIGVACVTHEDARTPCPYILLRTETILSNVPNSNLCRDRQRKTHMKLTCDAVSHHRGQRELHVMVERLRGLLEGHIIPIQGTEARAMVQFSDQCVRSLTDLGHQKITQKATMFIRGGMASVAPSCPDQSS